jgi:ADP-ribosylglycohydrolase
MIITGWDSGVKLLKSEIEQAEYEGFIVPLELKEEINSLHDTYDANNELKINELAGKLKNLPKDPAFKYIQPNDLEGIKKERPASPRQLKINYGEAELLDRLHGAWTGRAAGCALGKPVEGLGMGGKKELGLNGRLAIKHYLKNRGHWPLDFYFSGQEASDGIKLGCEKSWRENIAFMEPDDDIHYSIIGLKVLEERGPDFKWNDVANTWNSSLPYNAICTAETQAILNYNIKTPRSGAWEGKSTYATPEFTRRNNNPYREWIGAQIRADGWAYACAGNPELAAEFAWRDAHWTHTANGIYGEMFAAAMIAASFVEPDPRKIVEIGLSEIPKNCRLAEAVRDALKWIGVCKDFESFMKKLEAKFGEMSPVHTVNNALIVVMSLFYGKMNPDKSICISVMGALDTDCNGATSGSIVGAASGRKKFGGKLAPALNDTIKPQVFGFQDITMKELAERTLAVHGKVRKYAGERGERRKLVISNQ